MFKHLKKTTRRQIPSRDRAVRSRRALNISTGFEDGWKNSQAPCLRFSGRGSGTADAKAAQQKKTACCGVVFNPSQWNHPRYPVPAPCVLVEEVAYI